MIILREFNKRHYVIGHGQRDVYPKIVLQFVY